MKKLTIALFCGFLAFNFTSCTAGNNVNMTKQDEFPRMLKLDELLNKEYSITQIKIGSLVFKNDNLEFLPTISFKEGKFGGFSGCNRFFGEYKLEGEKIIILPNTGSTKMLCENMDFEDKFLSSFVGEFSLENSNNSLILKSKGLELYLAH